MTDMDDDVKPLDPEAPSSPAERFSSLRTFAATSVRTVTLQVDGFTTAPVGRQPADRGLGEPCGTPACPYALRELTVISTIGALGDRWLRDAARRWQIDVRILLSELRLDVFKVSSKRPLRLADLRTHPILYRVPITADRLRNAGGFDSAPSSPEWELVRTLRDAIPKIDGLLLPSDSGAHAHDMLVFDDRVGDVAFTRIGSLQDTIPTTAESDFANFLQRFINRSSND